MKSILQILANLITISGLTLSWMDTSEIKHYNIESGNLTISYGNRCLFTPNLMEYPITSGVDDVNVYSVCDQTLVKTTLLGSVGYDTLYRIPSTAPISRLATGNGTMFYTLSRTDGGNSSLNLLQPDGSFNPISNTTADGWQVQDIQITQGQLFGVGNRIGRPSTILTWGRGFPLTPIPPQPYPGFAASGSTGGNGGIVDFKFSDPNTLWVVNRQPTGILSMLMMYIYNRQTMTWSIGSYYMFNGSMPVPSVISIGGKPPITKFYGITPGSLNEYTLPQPGISGNSMINSRSIMTGGDASRSIFKGLIASNWSPTPVPSASATATSSASATATSSASATASATATSSASATASATASAIPTYTATASATATTSGITLTTPWSTITTTTSNTITSTVTPMPITPSPTLTPTSTTYLRGTTSRTPSPTPSPINGTDIGNMVTSDSQNKDIEIGFGVAVPILIVGVSGAVLFSMFKSGKLRTMFTKKPNYMKHGYVPKQSMRNHPVMSMPVMSNNPALVKNLHKHAEISQLQNDLDTVRSIRKIEFKPKKVIVGESV